MDLLTFLQRNADARKVFGQRELKIIEKQLKGINLTQSEKNRLSRDVRKKFAFIKEVATFEDEFQLKKSATIKKMIDNAVTEILNHPWRNHIQEIWLFGSAVKNQLTFRSDVDIAVVFDDINLAEATKFRIRVSGGLPDKVDIQVFNVLPQNVKNSITKNHRLLYTKNGRR